ncbi:MAG TPA: translational GTPase TypA [Kiritimatiellia bacterium]|nr:translational GTPase TypA [Kiritimatiellia bacterium]HNS81277.1 translational GTPase TypA [Kiritimatiellia bacterium]
MKRNIRNIGIVAHVDHGKTTLVDCLLRQSSTFRANEVIAERAMDSMDLEREKGITIKSKNASITWHHTTINIVDTPGHADFGGEVERILKMVDGVLVLVDAVEGPQAQTRFVLRKAIEQNLPLIFVVNKIDREHADPHGAHDKALELLLELNASEDQFHAPFLYVSGRDGIAVRAIGDERVDMTPLFETVISHFPPPDASSRKPFEMLVSNLDWSDYVGRIAVGKITGGHVNLGDSIVCIHKNGQRERQKITKIFGFVGMKSVELDSARAGDIVGIAGFEDVFIGETLCDTEERDPLPFVEIDPPTIQMQLCANDGPLAGRDGRFVNARQIRERLIRESRTNISISVEFSSTSSSFRVSARGELQIAILVETMRREGFELLVSRPEVIYHTESGRKLEPYENLWLEIPQDCLGDVLQSLAARRAETTSMQHHGNFVHIEAIIPTRGLIGLENYLVNRSSGQAVISHMFKEYAPVTGDIPLRSNGTLVSMAAGTSTAYALDTIQERGKLFIGPGTEVYEGMIVGENARGEDLPVNPTRTKKLTNVRASGSDEAAMLAPPVIMTLEKAIEFISNDEYVEATPNYLRLRKKILNSTERKRSGGRAS